MALESLQNSKAGNDPEADDVIVGNDDVTTKHNSTESDDEGEDDEEELDEGNFTVELLSCSTIATKTINMLLNIFVYLCQAWLYTCMYLR